MGNPAIVDPETVRRTAAEAWARGFALIENYRTMYPQAIDDADPRHVGGFGTFRHHPRPSTPADTDVVAPDNDTSRSWAWLDLRAEPWVVEVPATDRYYVLSLHDLDTSCLGLIGSRATGRGAGRHLVAGPGYTGAVPPGFDGVLRAATELVGILGRTYLAGPGDAPALRELQSRYRLLPLSAHLGTPPPPVAPEPLWPVWREEALESLEFFSYLDFLLGFCPVRPAEAELRGRLAELGVGPGDFEPAALPAQVREAMRQGIADGRAALDRAALDRAAPDLAAGGQHTTGWFGTRTQHGGDHLTRAVGAIEGRYGLPVEEVWCAGWLADDRGNRPPDAAGRDFTLRFAPGELPPARFFWSVTMYRLPERLLVDNPIDRYAIGDRTPGLLPDPDGGLTLHVRRERPGEPAAAANWLPAPDGPFTMAIRLYGPEPAVLDGRWRRPQLTACT
ncbi:DUF1254 domain-containing protein [Kitasatospora sp. NPDC049258]|uniref:DUF1254 domain-containing protein n=1 Tax=Kitasatospora sp. NPDC049258 TaxID=3155394 RepID=UPI00341A303E